MSKHLHKAKGEKNDEFYTQSDDIWRELKHYKQHFKGKIVLCNCDDPVESEFFIYFKDNFTKLGLKKLISTHYKDKGSTYKLEITGDINLDGRINFDDIIKTPLEENGDFRNQECLEILKEADIVVTNPPFSLFREYITTLIDYNKKFLIIGPVTALGYKHIFPLLWKNKAWVGCSGRVGKFVLPNGELKGVGALWYTNLLHKNRQEEMILWKEYDKEINLTYENYDAINVGFRKEIPKDYDGIMGVPITFLEEFNPDQFEIVGFRKGNDGKDLRIP